MEARETKHASRKAAVALIIFLLFTVLFAMKSAAAPISSQKVNTLADAAEFLATLGWETSADLGQVQNTTLPEHFDAVYTDYNTLQKTQGCDLTKYAGKEIVIFTLPILNYPNASSDVYATTLTYNGNIIGGDIHSAELNGFMHTLI